MIDFVPWAKTKRPTIEELQHMLDREGLEYELFSDKPRTKYGRHRHPFDDFIVIVTGRMKITTDTNQWVMKPGDRLNLPAGTMHAAEMLGKDEVRFFSARK